mgnify:CR=1 FL=1
MRCRHIAPALLLPFMAAACASTSTFTPDPANLRMAQDAPTQFVTEDGGQRIGSVRVVLDDEVVAERPLVALEAVEEAGFFKRLWHDLLMWWESV